MGFSEDLRFCGSVYEVDCELAQRATKNDKHLHLQHLSTHQLADTRSGKSR
jgi:hypothetical protein